MSPHDEVHQCDLACGRPAPHTWICWDCHAESVTMVEEFTTDELHTLHLFARKEAAPALQRTAHTTHVYGPAAPINLSALVAHHNLTTRWDGELDTLPHRTDAARFTHQVRSTCQHVRDMLDGETEQWTAEQWHHVETLPPMQSRHLVPWLRDHCGIRIQADRIKRWKERGQITPTLELPGKNPYYHARDVVRVLLEMA